MKVLEVFMASVSGYCLLVCDNHGIRCCFTGDNFLMF